MILRACFDASGTHSRSGKMLLAGHIGTVAEWQRLEDRWKKLKRKFDLNQIHATDAYYWMNSGRWSHEQWSELYNSCWKCFNRLQGKVAIALDRSVYDEVFTSESAMRRQSKVDTCYGLCFRLALDTLVQLVINSYSIRPIKIKVIAEKEPGVGVIVDLCRSYESDVLRPELEKVSLEPMIKGKKMPALQAADVLAWTWYKMINSTPMYSDALEHKAFPGERGSTRLIDLSKEALESIRAELEHQEIRNGVPKWTSTLRIPPPEIGCE